MLVYLQKQQNTLKSSLLFKKNGKFTVNNSRILRVKNANIFRVLSLFEDEHIGRFSDLYYCNFNYNVRHVQNIIQEFASSCSIRKQLIEKICLMLAVWTLSYLIQSYKIQVILIISFEQVYQRLIQNPVKHLRWSVLQKLGNS